MRPRAKREPRLLKPRTLPLQSFGRRPCQPGPSNVVAWNCDSQRKKVGRVDQGSAEESQRIDRRIKYESHDRGYIIRRSCARGGRRQDTRVPRIQRGRRHVCLTPSARPTVALAGTS